MDLLRQARILIANDLRQELRDLELPITAVFFSVVVLVMFGLAFASLQGEPQRYAVPGALWLTVAFVGALTLTRLFDREREHDTLRALLVAPVQRLAIYLAKTLVTAIVLLGCMTIVVPGLMLLYPQARAFAAAPAATVALVVAGCLGYAAVGTLFAAGLATSSGKNVLLSVVLFPLTTPVLLFALVATRALLEGHPRTSTFIGQLVAVDAILMIVAGALFETALVGARRPRR